MTRYKVDLYLLSYLYNTLHNCVEYISLVQALFYTL